MSENVEFTPEQQAKVDEIVKARVAREREKWEKESGAGDLQAQLEEKDAEIAAIKREHHLDEARRVVVGELAGRGITEEGRIQRILRYVDLDAVEADDNGRPRAQDVRGQLQSVANDMPELLTYRIGAGSGGSTKPVQEKEKPLTRQDVEGMSEKEINRRWPDIGGFLAGQRG